jgi:DNA-binding NarL/FixJ family response regulator
VLLVVAHPVVGAGLETLLRLERHYDVRRIGRLSEVGPEVASWQPDVALVDGVLLQNGERSSLGVPALVLSGNAHDGEALVRRLDDARGWLRKDPTPDELRAAVDRVLEPPGTDLYVRRSVLIAVLAASGVAAFLAWGFLAIRSAG